MSDRDLFDSEDDDTNVVVLRTSCSSESEDDSRSYRRSSRRSLEYDFSDVDMSELFSARKRKALNVRGSHSVDGGCGGRNDKQNRRLLHLKPAGDTVCTGEVFTPRHKQAAVSRGSKRSEDTDNSSHMQDKGDPEVKSALREITSLLNTVVKRVEKVENELKQQRSLSSSSSGDSTPSSKCKKADIPLIIRVCSCQVIVYFYLYEL